MLVAGVLCLAAAGCGGESEGQGEGGACAAAVVVDRTVYFGLYVDRRLPPPGPQLADGVAPGCNDTNVGPYEEDRPVDLRRVGGIAPEIAVYRVDEPDTVYLNPGAFLELRGHPLHDRFYGPDRPRYRWGGRQCTVTGDVSFAVGRPSVRGRVIVADVRTEISGFERAGAQVLVAGDRARVSGRCRPERILARRIERRP